MTIRQAPSRRKILSVGTGLLGTVTLLTACSESLIGAAKSTASSLELTIVTGKMLGKKGWPAYIPATVRVPAHATVHVRIVNFDDGTAPLPKGSPNAKVSGAVGGDAVAQHLDRTNPNNPGAPHTYTELNPQDVSHTFSVGGLGLNIPLPTESVVSFTLKTAGPGTYTWQCMAPCGSPPEGWGGAMHIKGYMMGSFQVV
ncbi:MAG: hypothetical protein M1296_02970 [Chloroflexi bacterium]|nr:hypothetical protein [Chloroflexota bacterium]